MDVLYYLMLFLFFGYVAIVSILYGLQPSVSETVYRLPKKWQWLFTVVTWGYALCAMIIGLQLTGNGLVFLSGAAIGFVGAAPFFHDDKPNDKITPLETLVHMIGAVIGITSMFAFLWIEGAWYLPVGAMILTGISYLLDKARLIFWLEIFAMSAIAIFYKIKL